MFSWNFQVDKMYSNNIDFKSLKLFFLSGTNGHGIAVVFCCLWCFFSQNWHLKSSYQKNNKRSVRVFLDPNLPNLNSTYQKKKTKQIPTNHGILLV